ncbi:hypothetical protein ACFYPN_07370 [Streptomyces sp. NPDC005576]|uniref:hypothetical protein n=1 Tax=Streptomyces sp. NPDC005576 TaxID=3364726 RepID=UPI003675AFBE
MSVFGVIDMDIPVFRVASGAVVAVGNRLGAPELARVDGESPFLTRCGPFAEDNFAGQRLESAL